MESKNITGFIIAWADGNLREKTPTHIDENHANQNSTYTWACFRGIVTCITWEISESSSSIFLTSSVAAAVTFLGPVFFRLVFEK